MKNTSILILAGQAGRSFVIVHGLAPPVVAPPKLGTENIRGDELALRMLDGSKISAESYTHSHLV